MGHYKSISKRVFYSNTGIPQEIIKISINNLTYNVKELEKEKQTEAGTSLVAQWLRICLPVQGTQVQALVQEDPTCCGATKPVCHNY